MRVVAIFWAVALSSVLARAARAELAMVGAADRSGAITGSVTSVVTLQPVANATVTLEGGSAAATTDPEGRFTIPGLSPGTYRVIVRAAGFLPQQVTDLVVMAGRDTPAVIRVQDVAARAENVDVVASYYVKPDDTPTSSFAMGYEEVRRAPGAMGDVSRLIQSLPGAIARDDGRNDIVARGGSPTENLMLVDGFEIPNLSHFGSQGGSGGPITMLNTEAISDVDFMAGGFPAPYGNRLSSVLEVSLREGNRRRSQFELDLGWAGAGVLAEGPIGSRGSWLVTARKSYLDLIAGAFSLTAIPQYSNYETKLVYDLSRVHQLSFVSVGGYDSIRFNPDMNKTDDPDTLEIKDVGWRGLAGVRLRSLLGGSGVGVLSIAHNESSFRTDIWDQLKDGQLLQHNNSREGETTAKYDLTYELGRAATLRVGAYSKYFASHLDVTQPTGADNPFSADGTRVNTLDLGVRPTAWQHGGYAQASARLTRFVTLTLGGRYDYYAHRALSRWSPRGGLLVKLRPNLELSASAGTYYQMPPLLATNSMPENATLDPIRSDHFVLGSTYLPRPDLKITVEAYHKRYTDYPVSTQMPALTLADLADQSDAGYLMPLVGKGRGRASGIELYVQKKLARVFWGQVSYAYSRTEQRALDGIWRPGYFDMPHVLALTGGWKAGRGLELSTKFTATSGRPDIPFDLEESARQNRAVYDMSRFKAGRTPPYHRLDLRLDHRTSRKWGNLVFYVEADNVYNRKNVRQYVWNAKTRQPQAVEQLKFLAVGGVTVQF
jgi:outer membrane receptor for ferrienterochelin and colicin